MKWRGLRCFRAGFSEAKGVVSETIGNVAEAESDAPPQPPLERGVAVSYERRVALGWMRAACWAGCVHLPELDQAKL